MKHGFYKLHLTTKIEREISIKEPHFYDFFINACERAFGRAGITERETEGVKWHTLYIPEIIVKLTPRKGKTFIDAEAEAFNVATFVLSVLGFVLLYTGGLWFVLELLQRKYGFSASVFSWIHIIFRWPGGAWSSFLYGLACSGQEGFVLLKPLLANLFLP